MPRTVEVVVSQDDAGRLIERVMAVEGVVGVSRFPGASIEPPGDVVRVQVTNEHIRQVLRTLDDMGVHDRGSYLTTQPNALVTSSGRGLLQTETDDGMWEEIDLALRRETHVGVNYLLLMALAGAVAAVGLWTDVLHLVIGAMVIAPGFEPILRASFGLVVGRRDTAVRGLWSTAAGYAALWAGAAAMCLLLRAVDPTRSADLADRSWVQYWTTIAAPSVALSIAAAVAGAIVVTAQRPVLTAGVMIALALIPGMAIAGMATMTGQFTLAAKGLMRWGEDALAVAVLSLVVIGAKQWLIHRRTAKG